MKAVVMAGGFGTRIQPLANSRPKPMLPIVNRPMMEHTMMTLKNLGIEEFIILLYFKPEIIQDYFKDGSDFGIKITYVIPDDDYGTAGAVKLAQEYIGDDNFIIISGDLVTDFDMQGFFDFHENKKSKLSIGLTSVENPLQFGVVIANEENVIEKFLEKPSWGEVFSDTINTGIYIIEPEILSYIPKGKNFDFGKDLFPLIMKEEIQLMGYNFEGYWRDVGNPESYRDVYSDILGNRVNFPIPGNKELYTSGVLYSDKPYKLDKSIEIMGNVVLGKNVTIEKGVKLNNAVIGDNVKIGSDSSIFNSVLWENIVVEKNVRLNNSVICNDNVINKHVNVKAGLILAEGCEIGELTTFEQDVTIWPDKKIEPASIVSNNVVWGSRYKNSIFENGSVSGKSNVELSCEMATKLAEAFAAQLPIGSKVIIACDYDKSSRMLKRAFLSGLLSAGINVVDLRRTPPSVLRYALVNDDNFIGGAYVEQSLMDATGSQITLFNEEALRIDSNSAKAIEKAFFIEKFRRVEHSKIGSIYETVNAREASLYKKAVEDKFAGTINNANFSVSIDLMYGTTADVFPGIINNLGIKNIVLNAYYDEKRLFNLAAIEKRSEDDISGIVKSLNYDMGIIIHPNEQQISIVTDKGEVLDKVNALLVVLHLLNMDKSQERKKVFLPTWAPDIVKFDNLEIERGSYYNFKAVKLKEYALVATVDGNFAFTEFSVTRDAMYASIKIMQLLNLHGVKLSDLSSRIDSFDYRSLQIECTQALKGKMMRKFLEHSKDKQSSSIDGVKIWENNTDWILMIPDNYSDHLNIYIQAQNKAAGDIIYDNYSAKIEEWSAL
ncbi:NTP transferase domain-containing protein [Candidatus Sulfurimonas marisnigri]|uniref:NTP transferase domain-containing protein n=1 Tax=Candidatus Sulfurimonas marisnigri TaxID=2740405 RepID=A0A7S7M0H9_9BACT|nr:sugar phosphate nucleotidyltransferase [Candidatus Sulfurimonas marisnigri]QOY54846.1 NTP transferase domain-containing protein [Candidatus Sulfurimonas marisnigri]